jgi:hypothetical protein
LLQVAIGKRLRILTDPLRTGKSNTSTTRGCSVDSR